MKNERDEGVELERDDARWVERVRTLYAPEPLDGARRSAFDARLRERIERGRWSLAFLPALGTAALAALLVWNNLPAAAPQAIPIAKTSPANSRWEQTLFYGDPTSTQLGDDDELPPEYQAIEVAFFDDV